jgi:hypothetical protein
MHMLRLVKAEQEKTQTQPRELQTPDEEVMCAQTLLILTHKPLNISFSIYMEVQ